jgi:hypothetical protein
MSAEAITTFLRSSLHRNAVFPALVR